jgi:hypothetical protein
VKQFEAALRSTQIDLDHTYIKAPVDGAVVARRVDVGQTEAASLATPTLFEIAQDLTQDAGGHERLGSRRGPRARGSARNVHRGCLSRGQVFKGAVTEIRKAPINVQNVNTYDMVIGVSNPDSKLFPGMTTNVKILVNQRPNVLKVLNAALRYHPASATPQPAGGGKGARKGAAPEQAVWNLGENNKQQRFVVTTGESDVTYMVQAIGPQAMDQALQEMTALLRERHRILPGLEDDFTIRNLTDVFAAQESSAQVTVPGGSGNALVAGWDYWDCRRIDGFAAHLALRKMVDRGQSALGPVGVRLLRPGGRVLWLLPRAQSGVPGSDRRSPVRMTARSKQILHFEGRCPTCTSRGHARITTDSR